MHGPSSLPLAASALTVADLVDAQMHRHGAEPALQQGPHDGRPAVVRTYLELRARINRLANGLAAFGIAHGSRIAVLSENRTEYLELKLAAAKLGAILACQNWRQAEPELMHCLRLAAPAVLVHSPRYRDTAARLQHDGCSLLCMGGDYEALLAGAPQNEPPRTAGPEDGLLLLYTSGTTGHPKAALISHRAVIARSMVNALDRPTEREDAFLAWTPLFHMGASDHALSTLMRGGKVILMDGFEPEALVRAVATERLGWLHLMPGTAERVLQALREPDFKPLGVRYVGVMADLMPRASIAELTQRLGAPYINTFGSTEAGGIASRARVEVGVQPAKLSKLQSALCAIRLVDDHGAEVPDGLPGEMLVRGPSLFSGYWSDPEADAEAFRGGWFHTGDVFVRNADGSLDYVDRRKYLIKSGGENIYPAEIERVLLESPRIADAAVVRRPDVQWGEVPVAFVVRRDAALDAQQVLALCEGRLARYKLPREIRFVAAADLPRSASGKVVRGELERFLDAGAASPAEAHRGKT